VGRVLRLPVALGPLGRLRRARTAWVVVFGAIALTAASVLYVSGLLTRDDTPRPSVKELGRLVIIVAPIALAATAPSVTLGAQAVSQKRTADGATSLARLEAYDGSIRLYELAAASYNPQWAAERGIADGLLVEFDGFVSKVGDGWEIELSRFLASCCAADAMPYSVDIKVPAGTKGLEKNQWLRIRGQVVEPPRASASSPWSPTRSSRSTARPTRTASHRCSSRRSRAASRRGR
jgi:hypothetical protein